MKKMKRMLALVLSVVMIIGMMTTVAYAEGINEVVVSIPTRNVSTSYKAYDELDKAEENKIILYVNPDEFPISATLYGSNGNKKSYEFSSYGTQQLNNSNIGGGTIFLYLTTYFLGGPLWIPEPKVYATIEIAPLQQEKSKVESTTEKSEDSNATIECNPSRQDEPKVEATEKLEDPNSIIEIAPSQQDEPKVESTKNPEDSNAKFEPLIAKIKRMSNYGTGYTHEMHIKDYASGKWDGTAEYSYNKMSCGSIDYRTYRWSGIDSVTGKCYNDIEVNIDYVGSLDVVPGKYFTFAVNYKTSEIEQWVLMENKDSWKLKLAEGEKIDKIYPSYDIYEDEFQGMVFTKLDGNTHLYCLFPKQKVEKIS